MHVLSLSAYSLSHCMFSHSLHVLSLSACSLTPCMFSHSLHVLSLSAYSLTPCFFSHSLTLLSLPASHWPYFSLSTLPTLTAFPLNPWFFSHSLILTPPSHTPSTFSQSLILLSFPTTHSPLLSLSTTHSTQLLLPHFFSQSFFSYFPFFLSLPTFSLPTSSLSLYFFFSLPLQPNINYSIRFHRLTCQVDN